MVCLLFLIVSHFFYSFQFCEIDLSEILPPDALYPFLDEIKKREKQRKQLVKKVASPVLHHAYVLGHLI